MRKPRRSSPHVNLLPLLDVLLCTMGTLIVVLGFLNRGDKASDAPDKQFSFTAKSEAGEEEVEDTSIVQQQLQLRIDQLSQARDKTSEELDLARRRLSAIEDHSRRITKQIEDLQAAAKQLPGANPTATAQQDSLRSELMRLNTEKMRLAADLNKARDDMRYRKPTFAVIPYDGIHKTHRRPIYIECRADAIILQPEGIVFTEMDFLGPNGPGNPLASALRAAREYWSQQPPPSPDEKNEPYPLLLVRPDGIIAYELARNALMSWDSEFGYELIDADWKLDYPLPPQTQLKEMQQRAVADARQRLAWLAQASPDRFVRKQTAQYRLAPSGGGLVRNGGMGLGKDPFAKDPLGGFGRSPVTGSGGESRGDRYGFGAGGNPLDPAGQGGGGSGSYLTGGPNGTSPLPSGGSGSGNGLGLEPATGNGTGLGSGLGLDGPSGSGAGQLGGAGSGQFGGGNLANGGQGRADNNLLGGGDTPGNLAGGRGGMNGNGSGTPGGAASGPMQSNVGPRYAGVPGGGTSGGTQPSNGSNGSPGAAAQSATSGNPSGSSNGNLAGSPGGTGSGASSGSPSAGSSMGQSSGGGDPSMSSGMPTPSLEYNANQPTQRTASRSMADMRGRNWALPTDSQASIPITRPIRLECWPDRIVVMSDSRDQQPQVIPLNERTEESIDKVVGAVREHSKRWGIAGSGMYWRPQLVLQVNPNGAARADDLQVLLANSGLDVKRK